MAGVEVEEPGRTGGEAERRRLILDTAPLRQARESCSAGGTKKRPDLDRKLKHREWQWMHWCTGLGSNDTGL